MNTSNLSDKLAVFRSFGNELWRVGQYNSRFALSHAGGLVLGAFRTGGLVLDAADGLQSRRFEATGDALDGRMVFSGDDTYAVFEAGPRALVVFDVATGAPVHRMDLHEGGSRVLAASRALPSTLFVGGGRQQAQLWDLSSGSIIREFTYWDSSDPRSSRVSAAEFSPNGMQIALLTHAGVDLWDSLSGQHIMKLADEQIGATAIAFSPDGLELVIACHDATVCVVAVQDGRVLRSSSALTGGHIVRTLFYLDDPAVIVAFSDDSVLYELGTKDLSAIRMQYFSERITQCIADAHHKRVLLSTRQGMLWRMSFVDGSLQRHEHNGPVISLRFSPNGSHCVAVRDGGAIERCSLSDGSSEVVYVMTNGAVEISNDGNWAYYTTPQTPSLGTRHSLRTNEKDTIPNYGAMQAVIANDGVVARLGNSSLWFSTRSSQSVGVGVGGHAVIRYSYDNRQVVLRVHQWIVVVDALTRSVDTSLAAGLLGPIAMDQAGSIVALNPSSVDIYRGKTLQKKRIELGFDTAESVAVSRDGMLIAVGATNGSVHLIDPKDPKALRCFQASVSSVTALEFSPDGTLLAVGGEEPTVRVYSVQPRKQPSV